MKSIFFKIATAFLTVVLIVLTTFVPVSAASSCIMIIDKFDTNQIKVTLNFRQKSGSNISSNLVYDTNDLSLIGFNDDGNLEIETSKQLFSVMFKVLSPNSSYVRTVKTKNLDTGKSIEEAGIMVSLSEYYMPGLTANNEKEVSSIKPVEEPVASVVEDIVSKTESELIVSEQVEEDIDTQYVYKEKKDSGFKQFFSNNKFNIELAIMLLIMFVFLAFCVFGIYCCIEGHKNKKRALKYLDNYVRTHKETNINYRHKKE